MIVSIHHYELAEGTTHAEFRRTVEEAQRRGLFDLPGLVDYDFLRGIKGARDGEYAAVWRYESGDAWRDLWGPVDDPVEPDSYPERWRAWEDELLAPLLDGEADDVAFTTYETVASPGEA